MKSILLATLSLAMAAPLTTDSSQQAPAVQAPAVQVPDVEPTSNTATAQVSSAADLEPLVWVAEDGTLRLNPSAYQRLANPTIEHVVRSHNIAKRNVGGLRTTNHFCLGDDCHHPPPPHDPCFEGPPPCAPCDPWDSSYGCDDPCAAELRDSCYTKWFCPSTYCNGCEGFWPEDPACNNPCYSPHPIGDALRRSCLTKWFCPSTYCPSNWCLGPGCYGGGCYGGCYGGGCNSCGEWPVDCEAHPHCQPEDIPPPCFEPPFEPLRDPCYV